MKSLNFRKLKALLLSNLSSMWRQRDYWLRIGFAWGMGLAFIYFDQDPILDYRFELRSPQKVHSNITLIEIPADAWTARLSTSSDQVRKLKELNQLPDSVFWFGDKWSTLLSKVLKYGPKTVGVALHFGETEKSGEVAEQDRAPVFFDRRIVWATQIDTTGRIIPNRFARTYGKNSGLMELQPDRDGILRRTRLHTEAAPHFALRLAQAASVNVQYPKNYVPATTRLVNFRGPRFTFPTVSFESILRGTAPPDLLKNKILIIGVTGAPGHEFITPAGKLSRAEVIANVIDNIAANRWISTPPILIHMILLLTIVLFTAWVTTRYPQVLSAVLLITLAFCLMAVSLSLFDLLNLFMPLPSQIISLVSAYIIFTSFQLTVREYQNNQLERERALMLDVEELKGNFLSLISHDLKTPLAKIQAICERVLTRNPEPQITEDVTALKQEANELNRYIKMLLQLSRAEAKDFEIRKDSADINDIVESVCQQLGPLAQLKNLRFNLELEPMFLIEVDSVLVHEVILNLIENAIKFSPDGETITIRTGEVDENVLLLVEDKGPGIPASERGQIFNKFFRGEKGKAHQRGSGLGLYLVKYFIERHHGKVVVDSQPGRGTKIGFLLPLTLEPTLNTPSATEDQSGDYREANI